MITLPEEVARVLDAASKRVRRIYVLRGAAVSLAAFLVVTLVAMAADAFFVIFDDTIRYSIATCIWLTLVVALLLLVVRPLRRPVSRRRTARFLDERHPEHEERLSTLVEIAEGSQRAGDATSVGLYARLAREGVIVANRLDLKREFTPRTVRKRVMALGITVALLLLSFIVFPNIAGLLFIRAVAPWVDVGNLYSGYIEVKPGSMAVLKNTDITITARKLKDLPGPLFIRISRKAGRGWGREFAEPLADEGYRTRATLDEREWRYRVSCGPAVSRYYTVRVCELPRYKQFTARLDYPAYTGWKPKAYTNKAVKSIQALAGTKVRFDLTIDEPGTFGEVRIASGNRRQISNDGVLQTEMVSNRVSAWSLALTSADGFTSPPRGGPFVSVVDKPPSIIVESPRQDLRLPPHAKLPIALTISDDVGCATMETRCSMNNDPFVTMRTEDMTNVFKKLVHEIDLSLFDLNDVQRIRFDFIVTDRCPAEYGGPHAATSTPVAVIFDTRARTWEEQTLQRRLDVVEDAIKEAEKRLDTAERLSREAKNQVEREKDKISEATSQKIEQIAHELDEAARRAEEQAVTLEQDGRFDPVAEELKSFAENELAPARDKIDQAQFADAKERATALARAQEVLHEAKDKLVETDKELKKRAEKVKIAERTQDLADRQRALARAAEKIVTERPADFRKLDAWKNLEQAAARAAADLARQEESGAVETARKTMNRAADEMERLKGDLMLEQDKRLKDEDRAKRMEKRATEVEREREAARLAAIKSGKQAEELLKKALERAQAANKTGGNVDNRLQRTRESDNFLRQAADAQRTAEDKLARAAADETVRTAQAEAIAARENSTDEAADRMKALEQAVKAQHRATAMLENPKDAAAQQAAEDLSKSLNLAATRQALAEVEKAGEKVLEAVQKRDVKAAREAADAADRAFAAARNQHSANALDPLEKAQRTASDMTRAANNPDTDWQWQKAKSAQQAALSAIRKAEDELAVRAGADAGALAKARCRENLAERADLGKLESERLEALAKKAEEKKNTRLADQLQERADVAADRAEGIEQALAASEDEAQSVEEASRPQGEQQAARAAGQSTQPTQASGEKAPNPDAIAKAAADQLAALCQAQADTLGEQRQEALRDIPSGNGGGGKGGQRKAEKDDVESEIEAEMRKAKRPRKGLKNWFRIHGSVKEGLGERDLKDIPPEYRDLVRRYFLRLSEE